MAAGVIYILVTPTNRKLLKIGKTTRTAEERAIEVSNGSGVPAPYWVIYDEEVQDCDRAEKLIHNMLASFRYRGNREFFEMPLKQAIPVVMQVVREVNDEVGKLETIGAVPPRKAGNLGNAVELRALTKMLPISIRFGRGGWLGKRYFNKFPYLITDRYLKGRRGNVSLEHASSVQVLLEKYEKKVGLFGRIEDRFMYFLAINTTQNAKPETMYIESDKEDLIMEMFDVLTTQT
jgi:hypothetical protein